MNKINVEKVIDYSNVLKENERLHSIIKRYEDFLTEELKLAEYSDTFINNKIEELKTGVKRTPKIAKINKENVGLFACGISEEFESQFGQLIQTISIARNEIFCFKDQKGAISFFKIAESIMENLKDLLNKALEKENSK